MIVWLASYPRSGNTFCRSVLNHYFGQQSSSVYGDLLDIGSNAELGALVGHRATTGDTLSLDELRAADEYFFIKTHEHPNETFSNEDLVFHIVRDGRDSCVSYLRYLHKIHGSKEATLSDVVLGLVPFGDWGTHTLLWSLSELNRVHRFRFEEITTSPDAFAGTLSDILELEPSRDPFPTFETFRKTAPSFFGSGLSGVHEEIFSNSDAALFELVNGPAMRLAGYDQRGIDVDEIDAYRKACLLRLDAKHQLALATQHTKGLEVEVATLERKLTATMNALELTRQKLSAATDSYEALAERYESVLRYTGLAAVRSLLRKFSSTD